MISTSHKNRATADRRCRSKFSRRGATSSKMTYVILCQPIGFQIRGTKRASTGGVSHHPANWHDQIGLKAYIMIRLVLVRALKMKAQSSDRNTFPAFSVWHLDDGKFSTGYHWFNLRYENHDWTNVRSMQSRSILPPQRRRMASELGLLSLSSSSAADLRRWK